MCVCVRVCVLPVSRRYSGRGVLGLSQQVPPGGKDRQRELRVAQYVPFF